MTEAEVCFGAARLLALFEGVFTKTQEKHPFYRGEDILEALTGSAKRKFAVLVSGDTGFYSAAAGLCETLRDFSPRLVPGVSSLNAFFARLRLPWQDAALLSAHGRETAEAAALFTGLVRREKKVFCLTGGNAAALGAALCGAGFGALTVHTGENLGASDERVRAMNAEELAKGEFAALTVLLVVNEHPSDGVPSGLNDAAFLRGENIPMTKSEVRAVALSKLALKPDFICYDIGAGTGSVSVEMALHSWRGRVFAVERREEALSLIAENLRRFHVGNVSIVPGEAPSALAGLPPPDAVFIGGSGGAIGEIIDAVRRSNKNARIVVSAVTLETAAAALTALEAFATNTETSWIAVSRGKRLGGSHSLNAQNPIMIISAGGE